MEAAADEIVSQALIWERLEPLGADISFRRHSLIYSPHQPAHSLYLLRSGQISLQLLSGSGRVLTIAVLECGHVFGHCAMLMQSHYDTYAEALKSGRVVAIAQPALQQVVQQDPQLRLALIDALGQHRLMVGRRLHEVAFKSVPARLASLLLDMADPADDAQQSHVPPRTHQQLAEMINAYRETVTKVIKQFREAHLLDVDHSGITLLNLARLRELAQG